VGDETGRTGSEPRHPEWIEAPFHISGGFVYVTGLSSKLPRKDEARQVAEADARNRLTHALVALEPGLRDVRAFLATLPHEVVERHDDYAEVMALRQRASDLVAAILHSDDASMRALADAEIAHRAARANLECGEATLAAYRRVLTPPVGSASLLDVRG